jgi:bacillithiol biosynthesis deacetylase BshB1
MSTVDLLVVGPHPDDVELFCGGTVLRAVDEGLRVGVVDLTRGERATRGTPEGRAREAEAAADILGLAFRWNLELPDLGLRDDDDESMLRLVDAIRACQPRAVLAPPTRARHPDHAAGGRLTERAVVAAGVGGLRSGHPRHRVPWLGHYVMRHRLSPSFIVDTSGTAERKRQAIEAHASQVATDGPPTLVGSVGSLPAIEARDRYYGGCIGTETGEPLVLPAAPGGSPSDWLRLRPPGFFFEGAS